MDESVVRAAFVPFGDLSEVQMPIDYQTEKHRGFAFVEFELPEDAQAAIDNMNDSELFGRTLKVNLAKPLRLRENSSRPVWADDEWLQKYAGQSTLGKTNNAEEGAAGDGKAEGGGVAQKRTNEAEAKVSSTIRRPVYTIHVPVQQWGKKYLTKPIVLMKLMADVLVLIRV